jgi:hypothetical protein
MAQVEVAAVQVEIFVAEFGAHDLDGEIGIALHAAALAAVGDEFGDRNARGDAGTAAAAMRTVDVPAGAAESLGQRGFVDVGQMFAGRIDHQVLRGAIGEVAARVRQRLEQPDELGPHEFSLPRIQLKRR